ncbi:TonB-dependent receptor domain-containing protein [Sphingomonas xanthus]|uniref:TonB-dependent receptor n=1 Tax=Sphingomonas xanthus TaxID=2594473 RepID=A0A516IR26_9SPHN|nr:TonB-dependent receptor [Sphingomonas xanthus]QDP19356.1 TonB-dependent receptor [Sphingomonas xanthus]
MNFTAQAHPYRPGLMVGVSLAAMLAAQPAYAQDATTEDQAPEAAPAEPVPATAPAAVQQDEPIIVTGTRIRGRPEFTSPDPVALIDPEVAKREGKFDTAGMLQSSPIAAGSTQITAAISSNFVTQGGQGTQTIDLRGLGPNRTLVLLNGRRAGPAGTRGAVAAFDLNVLPQSIVERVDVLKTGASSIYGSDAVAGVVNLFTKKDTGGLQIDANASVPGQSGGEQYRLSAIYGKKFDRGHIMVAADYYRQKELKRGDRKYLGCPEAYTFTESGDRADLIDPRDGQYKCEDLRWGHVWTYDLEYRTGRGTGNLRLPDGTYVGSSNGVNLIQFQYPGETLGIPPAVFQPGTMFYAPQGGLNQFSAPAGWFPTGYDASSLAVQNSFHPFVNEQTIIPDTKRYTLYGEASYELSNNVEAFVEFLANRRETYQNGWRQIWSFGYTEDGSRTGGFPGTYWAQGWEGWNWLSPTGITNHSDSSQKVDYRRGVAGLRGDFGSFLKGWSFDAHVQYSHSKGRYRQEHFLQEIYDVASFQTSSCVGTTLPISGKQCIDLPWTDPYFLRGEYTPEQADFMFDWEEGKTIYKQLSGEVVVSGNVVELPAGPLGVALGVHVRRDSIKDTPGDITLAGNAWGFSTSGITAGDQVTKEAFGEISIPLLSRKPFFKDLTFSGAARVTSVRAERDSDGLSESDNGNWTYKLGLNWAVNDWLRFRATYGTSFRSPALFEQFLADESSFISQRNIDPCINWFANQQAGVINDTIANNCATAGVPQNFGGGSITASVFSSGGIGFLEAETSKAKTASVILTPSFSFLPDTRVSLAVDYFDIEVKGEIDQLGAANIVLGCYSSTSFPNDPLCDLFTREPTGTLNEFAIDNITNPFINIASQRNKGVDVTLDVRHRLGSMGNLNFVLAATRQLKDNVLLLPGSPLESDNGEAGSPKWVGEANLTWTSRDRKWTVFYGIDFIGKTSNVGDFLEDNSDDDPATNDLCIDSVNVVTGDPLRGLYCPDLRLSPTWYHHLSVSRTLGDREEFEMTLGVSNLFNTKPPRISTLNGGQIATLGQTAAVSQYDLIGRRYFVNVTRRF